jgi:transcriptional regulator with XRE-family HTH domain
MGRASRRQQERLAEKLLQIRLALDLSQNQLLERLGLTDDLYRTNISSYERGEREPPLFALLSYARVAGVCVDVLIDDEMDLPERLPSKPKHARR